MLPLPRDIPCFHYFYYFIIAYIHRAAAFAGGIFRMTFQTVSQTGIRLKKIFKRMVRQNRMATIVNTLDARCRKTFLSTRAHCDD